MTTLRRDRQEARLGSRSTGKSAMFGAYNEILMLNEARAARRTTAAEAAQIARDLYSLDATATPLNGEFDDNLHLRTASGEEFTLKIMRPNCDPGLVELQIAILNHLRDLPVPRVAKSVERTPDGRIVWLLEWLPGHLWVDCESHSTTELENLGRLAARIDAALQHFDHPAAHRTLKWDLLQAPWIRDYTHHIADPARRVLVERVTARSVDLLQARHSIIHGDLNDHNILVAKDGTLAILDFGDAHVGFPICELAIACAYAAFGQADPVAAIEHVRRGFHEVFPLTAAEWFMLYPLIRTRLAVSVTNCAYYKALHPDDAYVSVSEANAWKLLEQLSSDPRVNPANIIEGIDLRENPPLVLDLSVGSLLLGADPKNVEPDRMTEIVFGEMRSAGVRVAIGRYNEARAWYTSPAFGGGHPTDEHRTIHLGLDLFAESGTGVCAPIAGTVHLFGNNANRLDFGPLIILKHDGFFTLYGHLSLDSLDGLDVGQPIERGQRIGWIGRRPVNGDWAPHLHFQIITDLQDLGLDFPGVCYASQRERWLALSPDPNPLLGLPSPPPQPSTDALRAGRRGFLGGNLSISYREPLQIVRGWRQYLYDETGRAFLDCYNNVPLVGHSHPRVVEAVQKQIALLNTNTRYVHKTIVDYALRLEWMLAGPLNVCYFLNSASEANELAIRLARAHTGREDIIVLDHAYHGNTNTLIDISPYKFNGPGGKGKKPWVHVAPQPDAHRRNDPNAGREYAAEVRKILEHAQPAAFIAESLPSVGGQVVFPSGYLADVYEAVRTAGGVCIADEVQVGFGRLGRWTWGFQMQDVVPDIVVLGKPMGNAFPIGGVVTTREIAKSFDNGMEFFSTFGGNPVACAAGLAVLEVLEEEGLKENARIVGDYFIEKLDALRAKCPIITDVRGAGLFLGIEVSTGDQASHIVNRLRERGILAGTDGPLHNVIKLRPPLIFSKEDADFFTRVFVEILDEDNIRSI